jgi:hypothetical protein
MVPGSGENYGANRDDASYDERGSAGPPPQAPRTTARFPLPPSLTPGGREAFQSEIVRYAKELGDELDRQAVEPLRQETEPEHTSESVAKARAALARRLQMDGIEQVVQRSDDTKRANRSHLAAILLTIATVGIGVMSSRLEAPWQVVLFGIFVAIGVTGLVLTWTSRVRRPPAH